jgi:hypothetical protein
VVEFVTWWVICALGTIVWILVTETILISIRGAAYFMQLKKDLGEGEGASPVGFAFQLIFFWWAFLGIWMWAASKGRGLLEHMVWMKKDTARMKAEREAAHREQIRKGVEKLSKNLGKAGWVGDFSIEFRKTPDGVDEVYLNVPSKDGVPLGGWPDLRSPDDGVGEVQPPEEEEDA